MAQLRLAWVVKNLAGRVRLVGDAAEPMLYDEIHVSVFTFANRMERHPWVKHKNIDLFVFDEITEVCDRLFVQGRCSAHHGGKAQRGIAY